MFEPKIVSFLCKWCTYAGADLAGTSRLEYQPNAVAIRLMCSSRLDLQHVLWAFRQGADGVFIGGCHPGDCHYQNGNYKTLRRFELWKKMLRDMGIEEERFRLRWISAAEGKKFVEEINDFIDRVRKLGPLGFRDLVDDLKPVEKKLFSSETGAEMKQVKEKKKTGKTSLTDEKKQDSKETLKKVPKKLAGKAETRKKQ